MAQSPSHKWGQIIGDLLEDVIEIILQEFLEDKELYLDRQGIRPARKGKKVSWVDDFGNKHDLDFVIERDGNHYQIGQPIAFIESAWRRYTKHSRNKAQEIQGAILPLVSTHRNNAPFIGAIIAGEFTTGAITQLKSLGFSILYFPFKLISSSFDIVGIDGFYDEDTTEDAFIQKIRAFEELSNAQIESLKNQIISVNQNDIKSFLDTLTKSINRFIVKITILPLHGKMTECHKVQDAIKFIENYTPNENLDFIKFEINISYNNGDKIEATFQSISDAIDFLNSFASPTPH